MCSAISHAGMSLSELIKGFEDDIVCGDVPDYEVRFSRSSHRAELERRGGEALPAIIAHLEVNPPSPHMDLDTAWGHLLSTIEIRLDITVYGPEELKDVSGWIAWAEQVVDFIGMNSPVAQV